MQIKILSAGRTDVGRKRKANEDSILCMPEAGVFCVADGIGGAAGGAFASGLIVDTLKDEFAEAGSKALSVPAIRKSDRIKSRLNEVSAKLLKYSEDRDSKGTGSTFVGLVMSSVPPLRAIALNAGDSRIYLYRGKSLKPITKDHSLAEMTGKPEKELSGVFKNMIMRAVGLKEGVELEETFVDVENGDIFLLCSDGLYRMLDNKKIASLLAGAEEKSIAAVADELVDEANARGGVDNISAVLIRLDTQEGGSIEGPLEFETTQGATTAAETDIPSGPSKDLNKKPWLFRAAALVAVVLGILGIKAACSSRPEEPGPIPPPVVDPVQNATSAVPADVSLPPDEAAALAAPESNPAPAAVSIAAETNNLVASTGEPEEVPGIPADDPEPGPPPEPAGPLVLPSDYNIGKAMKNGSWGRLTEIVLAPSESNREIAEHVQTNAVYVHWSRTWSSAYGGHDYLKGAFDNIAEKVSAIRGGEGIPDWSGSPRDDADSYCRLLRMMHKEARSIKAGRSQDPDTGISTDIETRGLKAILRFVSEENGDLAKSIDAMGADLSAVEKTLNKLIDDYPDNDLVDPKGALKILKETAAVIESRKKLLSAVQSSVSIDLVLRNVSVWTNRSDMEGCIASIRQRLASISRSTDEADRGEWLTKARPEDRSALLEEMVVFEELLEQESSP